MTRYVSAGEAQVLGESKKTHLGKILADVVGRSVVGSVVYQNRFEIAKRLAAQTGQAIFQEMLPIPVRDDHANLRHKALHAAGLGLGRSTTGTLTRLAEEMQCF